MNLPRERPMRFAAARLSPLLASILGVAAINAAPLAAEQPATAAPEPSFTALDALLNAGEYARAATVADEIVKASKPKLRDDDYLRKSVDVIKALMRRGFAELRLWQVDAAEDTFAETADTFKDREFQRLLVLAVRRAGATVPPGLVELELTRLDLLNARMKVLLARLDDEATRCAADEGRASAEGGDWQRRIARCLSELESLRKQSVDARESFAKRFSGTSGAMTTSPFAHALVGPFWSALIDGLAEFEQSRLPPSAVDPDSDRDGSTVATESSPVGAPDDARLGLRAAALEHLEKADEALRAIVVAVTPKTGGLKPPARLEAALLESELLVARVRVRIETEDFAQAREDVARILDLRREVGTLRKDPRPEAHPDQFLPLMLAADIGMAEASALLAKGRVDAARAEAVEARRMLDLAASLAVPEGHPLRGRLATLQASLEEQRAHIERSIPRLDAVDAAARRLIRAIDATPVLEAHEGDEPLTSAGSPP